MHHKTKLETIAKLAPLTATRCIKPDRFIADLNSGLCLNVSPKTIPGIKAPESPSPDISRNPNRIDARDLAHLDAFVITLISSSIKTSAPTRPSLLFTMRAVALKLWPGSSVSTLAFGVITRMGIRIT